MSPTFEWPTKRTNQSLRNAPNQPLPGPNKLAEMNHRRRSFRLGRLERNQKRNRQRSRRRRRPPRRRRARLPASRMAPATRVARDNLITLQAASVPSGFARSTCDDCDLAWNQV